jgi:hypothetical protein
MLINVELTFIAFAPKTPDNLSLMHNPASAWSEQINKSDTFFIFIIIKYFIMEQFDNIRVNNLF